MVVLVPLSAVVACVRVVVFLCVCVAPLGGGQFHSTLFGHTVV